MGTGNLLKFVIFLVLLEGYLLLSVKMHSKITALQFDDVDQTQMCIDVFSVVVFQKSF